MTDYTRFESPELEEIADQNWKNQNVLIKIREVLTDRKRKRAKALKERLNKRINYLSNLNSERAPKLEGAEEGRLHKVKQEEKTDTNPKIFSDPPLQSLSG